MLVLKYTSITNITSIIINFLNRHIKSKLHKQTETEESKLIYDGFATTYN